MVSPIGTPADAILIKRQQHGNGTDKRNSLDLTKPESTERMRGGWIRKGREAWVMVQCPDAAGFERVRVETAMPGGC